MPDFSVRPVSGVTVSAWADPETIDKPSRLRSVEGVPQLRWAVTGAEVEVRCTPDGGAEGAADAALGGRLFLFQFIEHPTLGGPVAYQPAGFTSIVRWFAPYVGHYTLWLYRPQGGAVVLHFDREI